MSNSKLAVILTVVSALASACALDVEEPESLSETEAHLVQPANTNFSHAAPADPADPSAADPSEAIASACTLAGATLATREAWCQGVTDFAAQEECWTAASGPIGGWLAWCSD